MARPKITEEIKRQGVDLILSGATLAEAAEEIGLSENSLKNQWRKWAAELGRTIPGRRLTHKEIPDELKREIADQMARGESASRLSAKHSVSETIIYGRWREWAEEFGIPAPPKRRTKPPTTKKTEAEEKEGKAAKELEKKRRRAVHLKDQGWNDRQVSDDVGLPPREIGLYWRKWAKMYGISLLPRVPAKKIPEPKNGPVTTYYVDKDGRRVK